ncbi:MAG: right-handed parallel beta-helix repeat-containing protein [Flavobacteriales bacterium]|nr:right-handed parallel beta-helix repeat-containing protein [Flavobacteriales bacterium]
MSNWAATVVLAILAGNHALAATGPRTIPGTTVGTKGFAAVEAHKTTLDFTGGNNIIHGMSNGIVAHKSYVVVHDCRFLDIHPDAAYDYAGNGAGIFAKGSGFHSLKQTGYGMYSTPSFEGCRWGICTEYNLSRPSGMNVKSTENNMLLVPVQTGMGTAYRVDYSGFMDVDYLSRPSGILNNKVFTHFNGIDLRFNDGALHVLVEGNDITFGDADCPLCRAYSAIFVSEGNMANDSSAIRGNTVHFLPVSQSRFGIALVAADDWLVAENPILMADNATSFAGIHLNGCRRPEVSCNTITGASNTYPLDAQAAIRNMMGSDVLISCNSMDSTANGILFNFVAPNTEVRGNFFHNHKWALHLDSTAVIGGQTLKGNLWYNSAAAGGVCALYEDSLNAFANPFLVNPTTIGGGATMPPSVLPNGWFQPIGGANYDCADDEGEDYCSQFQERGKERLTELDVRVANDSLVNDPYTEETKWMLKGRLYKKLDENPELQDSLQVMADLYDELQGSTTTGPSRRSMMSNLRSMTWTARW